MKGIQPNILLFSINAAFGSFDSVYPTLSPQRSLSVYTFILTTISAGTTGIPGRYCYSDEKWYIVFFLDLSTFVTPMVYFAAACQLFLYFFSFQIGKKPFHCFCIFNLSMILIPIKTIVPISLTYIWS